MENWLLGLLKTLILLWLLLSTLRPLEHCLWRPAMRKRHLMKLTLLLSPSLVLSLLLPLEFDKHVLLLFIQVFHPLLPDNRWIGVRWLAESAVLCLGYPWHRAWDRINQLVLEPNPLHPALPGSEPHSLPLLGLLVPLLVSYWWLLELRLRPWLWLGEVLSC